MGAKSTVELTRKRAIEMYIDHKLKVKRRKYELRALAMSNKELEDKLEKFSDAEFSDGVGLDNFSIIAGPEDD